MRFLPLIVFAALLTACFQAPEPGTPPGTPAIVKARKSAPEPMTERWTREQRECEVGNKKKQRRCMMPPPVDK